MKEEDFKKHFAVPSPITDAKLISHRRIGYVGYKTPEAAAKALKYFNKSFIRASRINVEFARPVNALRFWIVVMDADTVQVEELKPEKRLELHIQPLPQNGKRKHEPEPETTSNPKLKEFLNVMAPPSKTKIWSNEDYIPAKDTVNAEQPPALLEEVGQSDAEYEPVPKKRKRSPPQVDMSRETPVQSKNPAPNVTEDESTVLKEPDENHDLGRQEPVKESAPTSDADWLRSRTSRLLGLVDEDSDDDLDSSRDPRVTTETPREISDAVQDTKTRAKTSDTGSQTDENFPAEVESRGAADVKSGSEEIARLFIRNLSYEANEDDLLGLFKSYGNIEEVSFVAHLHLSFKFWL